MEERALLSTFVVNTTSDLDRAGGPPVGQESLRQAIEDVNADTTPDEIDFNLGGGGHQVITLLGSLPAITNSVTIDGTSQPGYVNNAQPITHANLPTDFHPGPAWTLAQPLVEIQDTGHAITLLDIEAPNCIVKGVVLDDTGAAGDTGVFVGGDHALIQGNYIGTDWTGTVAEPLNAGIVNYQVNNTIGGTSPGQGNLISGSTLPGPGNPGGIVDYGEHTIVEGNFIGTDASGTLAIANLHGFWSRDDHDQIGGTAPGAGNLISGNSNYGITLQDSTNATIQGNEIGTDISGTLAIHNDNSGVWAGRGNCLIGGTDPGAGNLISGNLSAGVEAGPGSAVQANQIGTDITGAQALGNYIGIAGDTATIGGTSAAARNLIAGNQFDVQPSNCLIEGNYIGTDITGEVVLPTYSFTAAVSGGGSSTLLNNVIAKNGAAVLNTQNCVFKGNVLQGNKEGTQAIGGNLGIYEVTPGNTFGGTAPGAGNVIFVGVRFDGEGAHDEVLQGNYIERVVLFDNGPHDNLVGGTDPGAGNVLACPVRFWDNVDGPYNGPSTTRIAILGNTFLPTDKDIAFIRGLGNGQSIDSGAVNDPGDADTGPNGAQNYPVLTAAGAGTSTTVLGTLNSTAGDTFRIEFFASPAGDPPGQGRAARYLGYTTVRTDQNGNATIGVNNLAASAVGEEITATATVLTGSNAHSTSELSYWISDIILNTPPTALLSGPVNALSGQSLTYSLGATDPDSGDPAAGFTYTVNFNDGTGVQTIPASASNGTGVTLIHSFAAPGDFTVTLTVADQHGAASAPANLTVHVVAPASVSGVVFSDFNDDGQVDFGENGILGVPITVTGTDDLNHAVNLSQNTDGSGAYVILNLRPGTYVITEAQQPAGYTPGIATIGTGGGTVSGAQFTVTLTAGENAMNYNYGERPVATGAIQKGQTAGIGFWNNKNGQALIKALNYGVGTQLGDWLAATFPHMFGAQAGSSDLARKTNTDVASFFQSRFVLKDVKLDAQVLATALAVYVTDGTLDSTGVGTQYGFIVGGNGVATATFNVGANGDAFGVGNNTVMTVLDFLLAADAQAVNGVLYNGNTAKRNMANNVFSAINQVGGI
jgi:hypothetical protein